ncbi:bifunctional DNA-formamidopyrimidine glycosylase/DNA-(apurinic or apyrimidinic site) lyase [Jongsikchunia kroppenstedtii]|uniref:bifunctional DNA-formamidopyrimidine glycosylase/DNA-(apurinic or apyrimidinic site) lyase n=1 Tax=Jongsikchunia kroppenstedtii TaxID=1121721 RepID=UPI00035C6C19|nr:bifunctional DNA-formamidopyrimidine glycosylase/DNA-(apurinic or apyrimidinic site) lyase [Jongsikchunia kroppenstedtii]
MPELPEVEVVRRGLAKHVVGRTLSAVDVLHPRAIRRHIAGPADFRGQLSGARVDSVNRRGKYMWLQVQGPGSVDPLAVVVHLGMSGQMLINDAADARQTHARVVADLDDGRQLRFVDQRTFGGWMIDELVDDAWPAAVTGEAVRVPSTIAHIAPDPFDPNYDLADAVARVRGRDTEIKRALLDQTMVSGIGNIYADEALWRARLHGRRETARLSRAQVGEVLGHAAEVMTDALSQGGTSFDELYVNVNGESGYFVRSLNAYGREGEPCRRCGAVMRREQFMNRSSFYCPRCQRAPRF